MNCCASSSAAFLRLKLDLMLHEIGIDLIHLLDDLDPGLLACGVELKRIRRRPPMIDEGRLPPSALARL